MTTFFKDFGLRATAALAMSALMPVICSSGAPFRTTIPPRLTIRLFKRTNPISLKGPITISITLTNDTSESVKYLESEFEYEYECILTDANGKAVPYTPSYQRVRETAYVLAAKCNELKTGEVVEDRIDLRRYYQIRSAGKYTLTVARELQACSPDSATVRLRSDALEIIVRRKGRGQR